MNRVVLALFVIVFITAAAFPQAQMSTGDIKGTVTDPSGAVVPGATITVTNVDTGVSRTTATASLGEYRVLVLPPGIYSLKIESTGFAPQTRPSVQVSIGETVVIDAQLSPASVVTELVVQTGTPLLESEKIQQSNTIKEQQIINLPLNKRDFLDLTMLTPGVTDAAGLITFTLPMLQTSGLSFMGQGARYNSVNIDGVDNNDNAVGAVRSTLSQEAAQEFQVNLSNFSAEFGRASGGLINIVSKSGTNKLHGDLFAFFRNQSLDARNPFAFGPGGKEIDPPFRRWQAGFTLGGPVKQDRTFFFLAYEGLRRRESRFVSLLEDTRILEPTPQQTAVINALAANPVPLIQQYAEVFRQQLTTRIAFPSTVRFLESQSGAFPFRNNDNKASLRLDHHLSNSSQMFGRLSFADIDSIGETQGGLTAPSRATTIQIQDYSGVFGETHFFGSNRVNEFRFQFAHREFNAIPADPYGPEININGVAFLGRSLYLPSLRTEKRWQWVDNFTLLHGRHEIKFGADLHYLPFNTTSEIFLGGRFIFGEGVPIGAVIDAQIGPGTTQTLAAFLAASGQANLVPALSSSITPLQAFNFGLPLVYQQGFGNPVAKLENKLFGTYVQDNLRATRRLTLNFGLRYDAEFQPPPVHHDYNNFAPRVGFAFNATNRTLIRGGYGIYYAPIFEAVGFIARVLDGTQISEVLVPLTGLPQIGITATSAQVWGLINTPPAIRGNRVIAASDIAKLGLRPGVTPAVISTVDKNIVNPYSQQGSLGIERGITSDFSVSANYLVNRGVKILLGRNHNLRQSGTNVYGPTFTQIDPRILQNNTVESSGSSTYHGLAVTATKRYSRKNQFQVSYTLSKAIDNVTDIVTDLEPANQLDLRGERGLASVDQRHRLVVSGVVNLPFEITTAPIFTYSSGHPFNLLMGFDANGDTNANTDRPPLAGRNTGIGPNYVSFDLRLGRDFKVDADGTRRISAIIEAFNLFNRVNYSGVNTVVGTTLTNYRVYGRKDVSPTEPLGFTSAFDPRQIQLAVKFKF